MDATAPPDGQPWTTYLAGQRLAKLIEAGYAPVSVGGHDVLGAGVGVLRHRVPHWAARDSGRSGQQAVAEITQVAARPDRRPGGSPASTCGRSSAGDSLHGAQMIVTERELGEGDHEVHCILRGNRVRRFKDFDPVPVPHPTVRLS